MNDLKDQFLRRSIMGLRELSARAGDSGSLEGSLSAEAFRLLHTIKGTAQTFGLARAARLAHDLEGGLSSSGGIPGEVLSEGISRLVDLLEEKNGESPESEAFSEKLRAGVTSNTGSLLISGISRATFYKFSDIEKGRLFSAHENGLEIFCLEAGFDLADFTTGFKNLKERLDQCGEIIAALPGGNEPGKIVFRFYVAAREDGRIGQIAAESGARLESRGIAPGPGLFEALSQIGKHGLQVAGGLGKEVNIIICAGDVEAGADVVQTIFDVLLHLVRNAVDHAFVSRGNIFISIGIKDNGWLVTVEDDGAGLDPDLVRSKAIESGLIAPGDGPAAGQELDLIFSPGFSTAESVTEISGRGVGLDAVKAIVEGPGGTIGVKSEKGAGTAFEIFLPGTADPV